MRVLLGLSALALLSQQASAVSTVQTIAATVGNGAASGSASLGSAGASVTIVNNPGASGVQNNAFTGSGAAAINTANALVTGTYYVTVATTVTAMSFAVTTNGYVAQLQYRFATGGSTAQNALFNCDTCAPSCDLSGGYFQNTAIPVSFPCSTFTRTYTYGNLQPCAAPNYCNVFGYELYDLNGVGASYSFNIAKTPAPIIIVGDPQIVGMQGQDFQVHGMPDEIFNVVSYPTIQVNARFSYLESGECHDNYTACFAHPGTYISEQGFRLGKDKVRVSAGSYKKGLTVTVNGKQTKTNVDLKSGAVELVNHRRVIVHTDIMKFIITNSDKFVNQEIELKDDKLIALGAERRQLKDNERFHPEVPLHGLQGQTWRNVEYASGLDYEGSIMDYHVVDGNLFGTDFVFNQFHA